MQANDGAEPISKADADSTTHPAETVEASFALLELCLEQLSSLSPVQSPDQIIALLPKVSPESQRLILVELIKYDLTAAAEKKLVRTLEFYWPSIGHVLPSEFVPFDLVLEEVQLRRAAGDNPSWEEYRQRFPDLAATIGKWLAGGDTQAFTGTTSRVPELPVGEQVDDFHILKQLGQGAFARVYLARQNSMQRLVALKATSRGSEEPQALSQLDHPNVVRVFDQREISDPPTILLYMQYLPGGTVADTIKQVRSLPRSLWSGRNVLESIDLRLLDANQSVPEQSSIRSAIEGMSWAEAVSWIGIQLAEGLGYADTKGVLHRDVKPANILLSGEAIPKLADFNVSCSGLGGRAGAAAYFGGSLAYMSPEQLQVADPLDELSAEELDGRSDLYALGIVLWELWQGRRPWQTSDLAASWTEAVKLQRGLRDAPFDPEHPAENATERALEKVIRDLLQVDPVKRLSSGKETAARLKLAFYPDLAACFEPAKSSLAGRLLRLPVLLVAMLLIFGPNTAASIFNYYYNHQRMKDIDPAFSGSADSSVDENQRAGRGLSIPGIEADFQWVSNSVNAIVFPLGGLLFLWIILPIARMVRNSRAGLAAAGGDLKRLWHIGNYATVICGILWTVSGVVFSVSFASVHSEFDLDDAFHFFVSLVLCGGVAWIYPYFGMTLLAIVVYYPAVIAPTMSDPEFDRRCEAVRQQMRWYLLSAALIPLSALGLIVLSDQAHENLILAGVIITGVGLVASFYAYQKLDGTMAQLSRVLGDVGDQARSVS